MAISAYPRTAIQGTKGSGNPSNGLSLMLLNPSTGNYEAATSSTFAGGGGGGGDATAANQSTQIGIETNIQAELIALNALVATAANQSTEIAFLTDIKNLLTTIDTTLTDIKNNATNGNQRTVIQSASGTNVDVDAGTKRLLVDTGTGGGGGGGGA
jgi:hypothetical protein